MCSRLYLDPYQLILCQQYAAIAGETLLWYWSLPKTNSTESALASYLLVSGRPAAPALYEEKTPVAETPTFSSWADMFAIVPLMFGNSPTARRYVARYMKRHTGKYYYDVGCPYHPRRPKWLGLKTWHHSGRTLLSVTIVVAGL